MNKKEAIQAVLDGNRVRMREWDIGRYIEMNSAFNVVDEKRNSFDFNRYCHDPYSDRWSLHEAKKELSADKIVEAVISCLNKTSLGLNGATVSEHYIDRFLRNKLGFEND